MAILHKATLSPSKQDLLAGYLPKLEWFGESVEPIELIGAYRFDDPAGQVGVEVHLIKSGLDGIVQMPLTYRGEPLEEADQWLVGTMEHSVLGTRWVYNAIGDPVYAQCLARAILTGEQQVELVVHSADGTAEVREPTVLVQGSGSPGAAVPELDAVSVRTEGSQSHIAAGPIELVVHHLVDNGQQLVDGRSATKVLHGTWPGNEQPTVLAAVLG